MKLPTGLRNKGYDAEADDMDFAEAIVRDCAKVCAETSGNPYPYADLAEMCQFKILHRYGLEPKP